MNRDKNTEAQDHPISEKDAKPFSEQTLTDLEENILDNYIRREVKPMRMLMRLYLRYWPQLLLSLFFYILKTTPVLALPIVTANIIDLAVYRPDNVWVLAAINLGIIVTLLIINIPTHWLYTKYHSIVMRRVEAALRGAMVRKLQALSISFHSHMQSGRIQSKLMRDVETVQNLSAQIFSNIPGVVINMVTALVVVISKSWIVFFFFLACVPTSVLVTRIFRKRFWRYNSTFRRNTEHTSADLIDMVAMTPITRAHALEQYEVQRIHHRLSDMAAVGYRLDMTHALFGALNWVLVHVFQLTVLVFSAYMAFRGKIPVGDISLYQSYFSTLTGQVSMLLGMMPMITKGLDSVSSIGEILGSTNIEPNSGKLAVDGVAGAFSFQDVTFGYEEDRLVLRGLNLDVRAGETIAIVGESGAGKSTILNLVLGFYTPSSGQVLLDGRPMTDIDLRSYRSHLAIVPQSSVLFTGTIRENITYGLGNVSEERLQAALKAARLTDFLATLPQGVDTPLDEHGGNLSGGQRQRISIARAIIRDPQIILFDEATSALDTVSEKEIQAAINNLTANRTTFIVAHRLSTIRNADRIAVMKDGVCIELGSYEELMAQKGEYWRMQTLQDGVLMETL